MPKIIVTPITTPGLAPSPEDAAPAGWPGGPGEPIVPDDVMKDLADYAAAFRVGAEGTFW